MTPLVPTCSIRPTLHVRRRYAAKFEEAEASALFDEENIADRPRLTPDDFAIYASYRIGTATEYYGTLKVVRRTDTRLLYPFDGAPTLGPFISSEEAICATRNFGNAIVEGDLLRPE
ncbi:DUF6723 family protein [Caballeronia temeraria]|uniref:DUF6723 family protein n=1 Tax=Caballeronia temeraria TaxID=1777137 RepID=UPI003133CD54